MRSHLLVVVAAFIAGCGSDESKGGDFDCKTSSIANGNITVCEQIGATEPGKYDCAPQNGGASPGSLALRTVSINSDGDTSSGSHDCPAGTVPQSTQPPVNGDGTGLGQTGGAGGAADDNAGTQVQTDGTSTHGGGHHGGGDDSQPPVGGDQTSSGSNPSSSSGGSSSGGSSGSSTPPNGGGGYSCESDGAKTTCTSTQCQTGYHAGANDTCVPDAAGCTLTQGYWKNHLNKWPVTSLTLGSKTYSQGELMTIFATPPTGDASLILAHQLIAALLNTKSGASSVPIAEAIAQAQAWLSANGSTLPYGVSSTSPAGTQAVALASALDAYNNGLSGVPHCN